MVLRLLSAFDQLNGFRPVLHFHGEHLQASLAPRQGIAALMCEAGHHLPNGRETFRLERLLLSIDQRGDILAHRKYGRSSLVVGQTLAVPCHVTTGTVFATDWVLESKTGETLLDAPNVPSDVFAHARFV